MMKWNVIEVSGDGTPRTEVAQVPGGLLFRTCAWMNSPAAAVSIATSLEHVPCTDEQARAFVEVMTMSSLKPGINTIEGKEVAEIIAKMKAGGAPSASKLRQNMEKRKSTKATRRMK